MVMCWYNIMLINVPRCHCLYQPPPRTLRQPQPVHRCRISAPRFSASSIASVCGRKSKNVLRSRLLEDVASEVEEISADFFRRNVNLFVDRTFIIKYMQYHSNSKLSLDRQWWHHFRRVDVHAQRCLARGKARPPERQSTVLVLLTGDHGDGDC